MPPTAHVNQTVETDARNTHTAQRDTASVRRAQFQARMSSVNIPINGTRHSINTVVQRVMAGGQHPVQRKEDFAYLQRTIGNQAVIQLLDRMKAAETADIHKTAAAGVQGTGSQLPHVEQIQDSFGRHDISGVKAFTGTKAATASKAIGAQAYTTDNKIAFSSPSPDLHTTAHEATHVLQQRKGVRLNGGVGEVGDSYERHADAVADKVVRGVSTEGLLSHKTGNYTTPAQGVTQQEPRKGDSGRNRPVQRLVMVMNQDDPTTILANESMVFTLGHISWARSVSHGPIIHVGTAEVNAGAGQWDINPIHFVEHGGVGNIDGHIAADVVAAIKDVTPRSGAGALIPPANEEIRVSSCYSASTSGTVPQSLISGIRGALDNENGDPYGTNAVVGQNGPSITFSRGAITIFQVVRPGSDTNIAGKIQAVMLGNAPAPQVTTNLSKKRKLWRGIKNKVGLNVGSEFESRPGGYRDFSRQQFTRFGALMETGLYTHANLHGRAQADVTTYVNNPLMPALTEDVRVTIVSGVSEGFYQDFVDVMRRVGVPMSTRMVTLP